MKKVILVLAFVFASSSLVNAENLSIKNKLEIEMVGNCFDQSLYVSRGLAEIYGLDDDQRSQVFNFLYSSCLDNLLSSTYQ